MLWVSLSASGPGSNPGEGQLSLPSEGTIFECGANLPQLFLTLIFVILWGIICQSFVVILGSRLAFGHRKHELYLAIPAEDCHLAVDGDRRERLIPE